MVDVSDQFGTDDSIINAQGADAIQVGFQAWLMGDPLTQQL